MYNHPLKLRILDWMQDSVKLQPMGLRLWHSSILIKSIEILNTDDGLHGYCKINAPYAGKIPAVPVTLFRDLSLTCFPAMLARHRFRTSGTTGPRGQHALLDTEVTTMALLGTRCFDGPILDEVSLVSSSADSSLGHMCRFFAPAMHQCFIPDIGVLQNEAFQLLRSVAAQFIPATAFAMASLLRDVSLRTEPIHTEGSVIMITGGFKGKTQEISDELIEHLHHLFPKTSIVAEYGMTELGSQMWSRSVR